MTFVWRAGNEVAEVLNINKTFVVIFLGYSGVSLTTLTFFFSFWQLQCRPLSGYTDKFTEVSRIGRKPSHSSSRSDRGPKHRWLQVRWLQYVAYSIHGGCTKYPSFRAWYIQWKIIGWKVMGKTGLIRSWMAAPSPGHVWARTRQ